MKTLVNNPFSSVWGEVKNVQIDQKASHDVLVTIAGQVLRFDRFSDSDGLKSLGLLRLTKPKVFLIVGELSSCGKNFIFAGWKNPQNKVALGLQPLVIDVATFDLMNAIVEQKPDWKAWEGSFSEADVNQKTLWN